MSKKILLVEDDTLAAKSLVQSLENAGYELAVAEDGKAGLEQALANHPDLIVTDIRMPQMDGLEMVAKLREDEWGAKVPVVILTADETTPTLNKALTAGITTYLAKSTLSPDQLVQQVRSTLGE